MKGVHPWGSSQPRREGRGGKITGEQKKTARTGNCVLEKYERRLKHKVGKGKKRGKHGRKGERSKKRKESEHFKMELSRSPRRRIDDKKVSPSVHPNREKQGKERYTKPRTPMKCIFSKKELNGAQGVAGRWGGPLGGGEESAEKKKRLPRRRKKGRKHVKDERQGGRRKGKDSMGKMGKLKPFSSVLLHGTCPTYKKVI